jgi:hypothetical protein
MYERLLIDGIRKEKARFSFVAHEEYVNIYCSYCNKATAKYEQFFGIKVQNIGALDCVLKKHEKSWCREQHNQCFLHPTNDEDKTADYHKTDEIGIFQYLQHVNAGEDLIKPQKIQIRYC